MSSPPAHDDEYSALMGVEACAVELSADGSKKSLRNRWPLIGTLLVVTLIGATVVALCVSSGSGAQKSTLEKRTALAPYSAPLPCVQQMRASALLLWLRAGHPSPLPSAADLIALLAARRLATTAAIERMPLDELLPTHFLSSVEDCTLQARDFFQRGMRMKIEAEVTRREATGAAPAVLSWLRSKKVFALSSPPYADIAAIALELPEMQQRIRAAGPSFMAAPSLVVSLGSSGNAGSLVQPEHELDSTCWLSDPLGAAISHASADGEDSTLAPPVRVQYNVSDGQQVCAVAIASTDGLGPPTADQLLLRLVDEQRQQPSRALHFSPVVHSSLAYPLSLDALPFPLSTLPDSERLQLLASAAFTPYNISLTRGVTVRLNSSRSTPEHPVSIDVTVPISLVVRVTPGIAVHAGVGVYVADVLSPAQRPSDFHVEGAFDYRQVDTTTAAEGAAATEERVTHFARPITQLDNYHFHASRPLDLASTSAASAAAPSLPLADAGTLPVIADNSSIELPSHTVREYVLPVPGSWDVIVSMSGGGLQLPLVSYVAGGEWRVLLYSEDSGEFRLRVRLIERQPEASFEEPADCVKAASARTKELAQWSRHSDWLVRTRAACPGWTQSSFRRDVFNHSERLPLVVGRRQINALSASVLVSALASPPPRPASHTHLLAEYLAANRGGVESETSYGRWARQPTSAHPLGSLAFTATIADCPVMHAHDDTCEDRIERWTWKWLPFGYTSRAEWLLKPSELLQCAARQRVFVQGDSLARDTANAMNCVVQTWGAKQANDSGLEHLMPHNSALGKLLPLMFFTGAVPPDYTPSLAEYQYLQPAHPITERLSSGPYDTSSANMSFQSKAWLLGAWPVSFTNSALWRGGLERMAAYMLQSPGRPVFVLPPGVQNFVARGDSSRDALWQTSRRMRAWIDVARSVMRAHAIQLVDLYTPSLGRRDERVDSVHYCPFVMQELAHIMWKEICQPTALT